MKVAFSKIFYYECSSYSPLDTYTRHYSAPFNFLEKSKKTVAVYTPSAIGVGTWIGPHADILKSLKVANCIIVNVANDHQHLEQHLSKLFNITQIQIPDHPTFKSPARLDCFPSIPIIVVTEFPELIKQTIIANHFPLNVVIQGNLSANKNSNPHKVKKSWQALEEVVSQLLLNEKKQIETDVNPTKGRCLIM